MSKKKILIMTDSCRVYTGFANIGRHVANHLHESGKWEVHYLGWFDRPGNKDIEQTPFPLYHTMMDKEGRPVREDSYAYRSFKAVHDHVDPDVVWVCGDIWMSCANMWSYADKATRPAPHILYVPIDGNPLPMRTKHGGGPSGGFVLDWSEQFQRYDTVVAYCDYGVEQINATCGKTVCTNVVHHGVDCNIYTPLPRDEQLKIKKEKFGLTSDDFLMITVARNQPRKLYPTMINALKKFIGEYEKNRKVYWYIHAPLNDPVGWDFSQLLQQAGIGYRMIEDPPNVNARVILDKRLGVGVGPTDEELNGLYNAADIGLYIYSGEGWALPPMETMAAGTPCIMTNYSAPIDWAKGAACFVDPVIIYPEPQTQFMRAQVEPDAVYEAIVKMYGDKELRKSLRKKGLEVAKANDWDTKILPQWEEFFDSIEIKEKVVSKARVWLKNADEIAQHGLNVPQQAQQTVQEGGDAAPVVAKVSVVIPTHVGQAMLQQCIESVRNAGYPEYEIIIIDNGAWTRDVKHYIAQLIKENVRVVKWSKKYCPAKVLNMAAKEATGHFLLFLDNDTIMQPGAIHAMLECLKNEKCGISTVTLKHPTTNQYSTGYDYDFRLGFIPSITGQGEGIVEKHAIAGSCMMVPRLLFDKLGGFDERYSLFWQDVDLCMRAREIGYASMCNTNSTVIHAGGVTRRYLSKTMHTIDDVTLKRKWWPAYIPRNEDEQEQVIVVKLLTMGDAVLVTTILPAIRKKHEGAHITLYTLEEYADIFADNPHVDEVKTVGPLKKEDFGASWSLHAYDAVMYNILQTDEWDYFYPCNQLDYWMEYRRAGTTMAQTYADMFDLDTKGAKYDIRLKKEHNDVADELISTIPGNGPVVVVHTTAGWDLKEWTLDGFKEITKRLYDTYSARIFVVGGPDEKLDSQYVKNVGGELTLRGLTALLSKADLFIGGDSGPLHLAKAACAITESPAVLGLFGCTNPMVVGFDDIINFIALQSQYAGIINCGFPNCPSEKKAEEAGKKFLHCSAQISVENVWKAVVRLMERGDYSVTEYWKGANKCKIHFQDWEWVTTLLEGESPEAMCPYGKDLLL